MAFIIEDGARLLPVEVKASSRVVPHPNARYDYYEGAPAVAGEKEYYGVAPVVSASLSVAGQVQPAHSLTLKEFKRLVIQVGNDEKWLPA